MHPLHRQAFTLIELLIVVAIIAILAAIAVPNFLEAQVRSKLSRVRADLRTVSTGLESYAVDHTTYPPNDGVYNVLPIQITTPVAYLSTARLVDPFTDKDRDRIHGDLVRYYTYTMIVSQEDLLAGRVHPAPPNEGIDGPFFNLGALQKYGRWRLVSNGPDRRYSIPGSKNLVLRGADLPYDPSNGTVSWGNILRTQKDPLGATGESN